jgi:hypothetical protein
MSRTARTASICLTAALVGLGPALALAAKPKLVRASSGPLSATLTAPPAKPKINTSIPITVTATLAGKPAHATAVYEFLFAGAVVSTQYVHGNRHFSFTGHYGDTLDFPKSAVGQPLTFRVVLKADGRTVNLNAPVTAQQ